MGFWSGLGDAVASVGQAIGRAQEIDRAIESVVDAPTSYAQRKHVEKAAERMDNEMWRDFFNKLEDIAMNNTDGKGEQAGVAADYARSLRAT